MVELVDTLVLGTSASVRVGSNPSEGTIKMKDVTMPKTIVGKSKNNHTGIVHGIVDNKVTRLKLFETACGKPSGLFWTKADNQPITCLKCLSELPSDINGKVKVI